MMPLRTPGVYVEEKSTLPPSVAEVSTAVPAFLGYTEKGEGVKKINTLLEYEELFGGPQPVSFLARVALGSDNAVTGLSVGRTSAPGAGPTYLMYYYVAHYFKNGGGPCYIIPVGRYSDSLSADAFTDVGLALLEQEDEPTLIVLADAVNLPIADYCAVCAQALLQCDKLKDRFLIADVPNNDVAGFRNGIGTANLSYAAAYHPYLTTTLIQSFGDEDNVDVRIFAAGQGPVYSAAFPAGGDGITVTFNADGLSDTLPRVTVIAGNGASPLQFGVSQTPPALTIRNTAGRTGEDIATGWTEWVTGKPARAQGFSVQSNGDGSANVAATPAEGTELPQTSAGSPTASELAGLTTTNTGLYNQIKDELSRQRVTLPPSPAMAGIFARVDRSRGVWKAPANESVLSVLGPVEKITDQGQEGLNIDPNAGKSINVIRHFAGKGTLVWGARTLAGNDNEWRYVPVRRLFITIEESTKKASAFAVFEPNDAATWLKVKGMIEAYLFGLWERGALAGAKPEDAFYVNVGLGKTMTPQDVLEGRLIVEIGIAAVRPAEFIVLRFMHKLQVS